VLEPFAGSGTTLVTAKRLGLRYVGFEIDKDAYNGALVRLAG
jgi:DNA modification methylase